MDARAFVATGITAIESTARVATEALERMLWHPGANARAHPRVFLDINHFNLVVKCSPTCHVLVSCESYISRED